MKFLVDENVGQTIIDFLKNEGFDIIIAKEDFFSREDHILLEKAFQDNRFVITNDKDFGELVYRMKLPCYSIILFRFKIENPLRKINTLKSILRFESNHIKNKFIVATENKIRIRSLN